MMMIFDDQLFKQYILSCINLSLHPTYTSFFINFFISLGDVIPIDDGVTGQGVILHHFDRIAFGRYHLFRFEAGGIHGRKNGKNSDNLKNGNSHVTVMINENDNGKDNSTENGSYPSPLVPPGWEYAQEELMIKNDPKTLSSRGSNLVEGHRYDRSDVDADITIKTRFNNHCSNNLGEKNILTTGIEGVKRFVSVKEDSVLSKTVSVSSPDRNNRSWTGTKSPPKISDSPGINLDRNKHSSSVIDRGNDFRNNNNILQFETSSKIKNKNRELINLSNLPNRTKSNIQSSDRNLNITFDNEVERGSSNSIVNSVNSNTSNQVSQVSLQSSISTTTRIMLVRPKVKHSSSKDDDNNIENDNNDNDNKDNDNDNDNGNDIKREDEDRKILSEFYPDMDMDPPRNGNMDPPRNGKMDPPRNGNGNGEVTERKRAVRNMVENHIGDYMSTVQRDSRRDCEVIERTNGGRTRRDSDTAIGRNGIIVENGNESRIVNSRILISSNKTLNVNERLSCELNQSRNARTTLQRDINSTNIEDGKRKKSGDIDIYDEAKKDATSISSHIDNTLGSENNEDKIIDGVVCSYNGNNDNNDNDTNGSNININPIDNNHTPDKDNSSFVTGHEDSSTQLNFLKENNKYMKNNSDKNITKIDSFKNNNDDNNNNNNNDNNDNNNNNNNDNNNNNGMEIQVPTFEKEALALQLELAQMQRALQDRMHRYQVLTSFNPEKLNQ